MRYPPSRWPSLYLAPPCRVGARGASVVSEMAAGFGRRGPAEVALLGAGWWCSPSPRGAAVRFGCVVLPSGSAARGRRACRPRFGSVLVGSGGGMLDLAGSGLQWPGSGHVWRRGCSGPSLWWCSEQCFMIKIDAILEMVCSLGRKSCSCRSRRRRRLRCANLLGGGAVMVAVSSKNSGEIHVPGSSGADDGSAFLRRVAS